MVYYLNSVCNQGVFVVSLSYAVNSCLLMWFLKVGMGCVLPVAIGSNEIPRGDVPLRGVSFGFSKNQVSWVGTLF